MDARRSWWFLSGLILICSLVLFACGGGGGSSSSTEPTTGSVAVLVTDAPSDEFKAIDITITGISLIDDEDNLIEIWSMPSGQTIDLLELETEAELFTLASDVPVGLYNKIRLQVSVVELVNFDDSRIDVDVPASGKIDLNPRGQFYVSADETLVVQLDIDANKSIHLVNPNHYRLRPVVFVDILTVGDIGRLVRLPGEILSVDTLNNQFVLSAQNREFLIHVDNDTLYFGEQGTPTAFTGLLAEDLVTVIGHFRIGSDDSQPEFDAVLVEVGDYQRLRGTVTVGIDSVTVTEDGGEAVNLAPETAYYDCFGMVISYADLVEGQRVAIDAIIVDEAYYAALVVTCYDSVDTRSGELEVIDPLTLTVSGQCAEEATAARYYRLGDDSLTEIIRADLSVGTNVLLFGDDDVCFSYRQLFSIE
ncbi:MAG: DUF4382 domain-containing protein [Deltaproteobacteria bacterium]|nr:DUF4382 domain-containing protein [Deltaproteobacteria bacterium]